MLTLLRVEKYCTRLDIVVWPSFPAPLSFQVGWSAFSFLGKKWPANLSASRTVHGGRLQGA